MIGSVDNRFKKNDKLTKRWEYIKVSKTKYKLKGKYLYIDYLTREKSFLKMGVSASTRFGNAPERNRFKRIAREAFRLSKNLYPPNIWFVVRPRTFAKQAKMEDIQAEMIHLLNESVLQIKS